MLDALQALWDSLSQSSVASKFHSYVAYIKEQVYAFKLLPRGIRDMERRADAVAALNDERQLVPSQAVQTVRGQIGDLHDLWTTVDSKLELLLPQLAAPGLGAIPLALAGLAAAVALGVVYIFSRYKETSLLLDAVERKVLTPAELRRLRGAGGLVPDLFGAWVMPVVLLGVGAYFVLPLLRPRRAT